MMTALLITILFGWYLLDLRGRDETVRPWPASLLDTGEILLLGIFLQYAADLLLLLLAHAFPENYQAYMERLVRRGNLTVSTATLISTVIMAPFLEELLYRGVLFRKARDHAPFVVCNIIQSVLFGILHGSLIQAVFTFLLGLLLGWMTAYYQSVFPSILLHTTVNLCGWLNLACSVTHLQKTILALGSGAVILAICLRPEEATPQKPPTEPG